MQYCEKQQHLRSLHPQDPAREQKIAKELGKKVAEKMDHR